MKPCANYLGAALAAFVFLASGPLVTKGESGKNAANLNIPIPLGHAAKGVKLPYYDAEGKLQMDFSIDSAYRVDEIHLQMKLVKMQTYDEDGKLEMTIDMPSSVLDLSTRIVTSDKPVTIRRTDFEITGDTMQFDTQTHSGKIVGSHGSFDPTTSLSIRPSPVRSPTPIPCCAAVP